MKKNLLILTVAITLLISACGSERTDNNGSDSMTNDNTTMDTATMSTDSGAMGTDTTTMGSDQTSPDSISVNPQQMIVPLATGLFMVVLVFIWFFWLRKPRDQR